MINNSAKPWEGIEGGIHVNLRQTKPIHLWCPECGYDFSYNTNHVEERIDNLKRDVASIMAQMKEFKAEHPSDYHRHEWYWKAKAALAHKQCELVDVKKARKATVIEIKAQQSKIFYQLVKERLGEEETIKLMKEAEEQMIYYNWDMATQTFTRFEGA